MPGIAFLRHQPSMRRIGDGLCAPMTFP